MCLLCCNRLTACQCPHIQQPHCVPRPQPLQCHRDNRVMRCLRVVHNQTNIHTLGPLSAFCSFPLQGTRKGLPYHTRRSLPPTLSATSFSMLLIGSQSSSVLVERRLNAL